MNKARILGIDPGTNFMGYAMIIADNDTIQCICMGTLRMKKYSTQQEKLKHIFQRIRQLVKTYKPAHMAIEAPFFGKNVQSMLKLGRAQGVAIAAAITANVPVSEYSPKKIKLSVTGNGNAAKEQVQAMLGQLVTIDEIDGSLDASDALAAAVCHYYQSQSPLSGASNYVNWADFIKDNPDRVK
jgi:crossover junction endodeoxyribonuclease RuvC